VYWYLFVRPVFSAYDFFSLSYEADTLYVAYLWVSLECGKMSYHFDLYYWSFAPLFENKCLKWNISFVRLTPLTFFFSEDHLILLNIDIDIEDVHVPRFLIFFNIWENYRLLKAIIFEKREYMFYIGYIICPANSFHNFLVKTLFGFNFWMDIRCIYASDFDFLKYLEKITRFWT
jgi:hypothetical protein